MRSAPYSIILDRNKGIVIYKEKVVKLDAGRSFYTSLYLAPSDDIFVLEVNPKGYVTGQIIDKDTMETIDTFFNQNPDDLMYDGNRLKKSFYDYSESRQADIVCQNMRKCSRGSF
jgi:hypothetical protein